jgi:hypothetical protein
MILFCFEFRGCGGVEHFVFPPPKSTNSVECLSVVCWSCCVFGSAHSGTSRPRATAHDLACRVMSEDCS